MWFRVSPQVHRPHRRHRQGKTHSKITYSGQMLLMKMEEEDLVDQERLTMDQEDLVDQVGQEDQERLTMDQADQVDQVDLRLRLGSVAVDAEAQAAAVAFAAGQFRARIPLAVAEELGWVVLEMLLEMVMIMEAKAMGRLMRSNSKRRTKQKSCPVLTTACGEDMRSCL